LADKEGMERKVWLLPAEMVDRLKSYQADQGIASEVEAARRLLDSALQMRDTVPALLAKLKSRFADEKDLRILARDFLATHTLVEVVRFEDAGLIFWLKGDHRGMITVGGRTFIGEGPIDNDDDWQPYPRERPPAAARPAPAAPSWDTPRGGDLDDEIPF
jgi:hypothetical protein